ncbi:PqqD family protein [Enterococcus faecium]|nr:PqqD family protein [Enterococcus faecium]EME3506633.1 PqqD family protein [Enterococcus faecium]EMF0333978.1 PqqD family protein [Enterococcus faecium]EMF0453141.1 PqqD family protein [Enterococcus faecium]
MNYFLEKTVKIQKHIDLDSHKSLFKILQKSNPNTLPNEPLSIIARNGVYIELDLVGMLIIEMILKRNKVEKISENLSLLFEESKANIQKDVIEFLEELKEKGYIIKQCLS